MRSPEEVAEALTAEFPMEMVPDRMKRDILLALADHVKERDAEHELRRREERDEAFTAGWMATVIYSTRDVRSVDEHEARREAFQAARRRAIEGLPANEPDQPVSAEEVDRG